MFRGATQSAHRVELFHLAFEGLVQTLVGDGGAGRPAAGSDKEFGSLSVTNRIAGSLVRRERPKSPLAELAMYCTC